MMGKYVPYDPETEVFLNNFFCRFPFGEGKVFPEGTYRAAAKKNWKEIYRETLRKMWKENGSSQNDFEEYCEKRSDKRLDQTPEQFFAELDRTVSEVGLSLDGITAEIRKYSAASKDCLASEVARQKAISAGDEMNEYLRPVYIAMRNKGYSVTDLWA